jgi:hypothetical protein
MRPSAGIKEGINHDKVTQDAFPLFREMGLHKCRGANRDTTDGQSEDFISVSISDRPIWDATPRSIPFNSAELVGNDACRHPRLELEANLGEIRRKVLAGPEDILFGTDDVVVIDDSY